MPDQLAAFEPDKSRPASPPEYMLLQWIGKPPRHKISSIGILHTFLDTCLHAQTLEAYSARFACTVWIALPCKQWSCNFCAQKKIQRLAIKTEAAQPNRMLTLTVDPGLWENPRAAFDGTRRQVPELMRFLRTKFGDLEYLRVTELTRGGWPHYHLLVRSAYIPHEVVKRKWRELTGAIIVDLRQVKKTFNCFHYLVKYLSKMHKIAWTERHVSYSRGFFPPEEENPREDLALSDKTIIEAHPSTYIYAKFRGATISLLGKNLYALDPREAATDEITNDRPWETCADGPNHNMLFYQRDARGENPALGGTPLTTDQQGKLFDHKPEGTHE